MSIKKSTIDDNADRTSWRIDTDVWDDSVGQVESAMFSPLGAGVMDMTPTTSSLPDHRDPWQRTDNDDAASLRASLPHEQAQDTLTPRSSPALGGILNSTVKPLSASEKRICLDSFCSKYAEKGGFPIREAIDLYHAVGTSHVNFSKVWMLVDPDSVCKIDQDHFCAFIALVNSIVEQGDAILLPVKALGDEEIRWLAGRKAETVDKLKGGERSKAEEQDKETSGGKPEEDEGDVFYDVPLDSSWRTSVHGNEETATRGRQGKINKKKGWSLSNGLAKLSLRKKNSRTKL